MQNKLVSALLMCSIVLTFVYWLGLFEKQLNLLDSAAFVSAKPIIKGGTDGKLVHVNREYFKSSCQITRSTNTDLCGFTLSLSNAINQGLDFSDFSSISIDIHIEAPVESPQVKLSLRNFSDKYSVVSDPASIKYNSVVLKSNTDSQAQSMTMEVPLEYLYVDYWWINELNIPLEDAQLEFTNISSIDLVNQDTSVAGIYTFTIKSFKLNGNYFSLTQLLIVNLMLWGLVIFFLIKRQGQSLLELSTIDTLTGLSNRRGLQIWIDALRISNQNPQDVTLCYIDIDDFKKTNDTFGHKTGDLLLQAFCSRIGQVVEDFKAPKNALLFTRMSGDEFIVVCRNIDINTMVEFANAALEALSIPVTIENNQIQVNISMGIARQSLSSSDTTQLFMDADAAMYMAKKSGKNQFKVFSPSIDAGIIQHKAVAKIISDAIALNQFDLKFMPIFDMQTKLVKNVEVLIESDTSDLDGLSTKKIVEIAEEFNLIQELDEWVLNNTLELLSENKELIERLGLTFCINVSTLDLQNKTFFESTKLSLEKYQIPASWIELEITENSLLKHDVDCTDCLENLRELGVSLSLDEFGTGYTAFNQLINYPVNKIKIDSSYADAIGKDDAKMKVLTDAIVNIAGSFNLQLTACGINNLDQYYYFANKGCDFAQGYLLSEPLTLRELVRGLRNQASFSVENKVASL